MNSANLNNAIYTIGHSTRTLQNFLKLLQAFDISRVVDIRTIPRSRTNPQFNLDTLPQELNKAGINYLHMAGLGGLRRPAINSPNAGWRNSSFRGFADYMQDPEFQTNLRELVDLSKSDLITLMCAEAVPWRCHRSLIADALTVRGFHVEHILSPTNHYSHKLTSWAYIDGLKITYPPENNLSGQ